jgi:predicted dehydrogenase/threonine dehydrogenase-like Zn-dependent dehydrogenase
MRQVLQDLRSGSLVVDQVPAPGNFDEHVIIRTESSLISSGTEKMLREFGKAGYFGKAKQQPEKVDQAIRKIRTDGIWSTYAAISAKLDEALPLGYSNVGTVVESAFDGLEVGDRVVSNGFHADVVRVPGNLCAAIPGPVSNEHAAFTVVGAVALQAVRLIDPTLGEKIGVIGVGLVGQLCSQILRANGCAVLAADISDYKCKLAKELGATTVSSADHQLLSEAACHLSSGHGLDGVIIAASSSSKDVINHAAEITRKRGRIVLVGSVGMEFQRDQFYKKELSFQVSSSYGPGRYDPMYELNGMDYPLPFVRWTAQRNFMTILDLIAEGRLQVGPLISDSFDLEDAEQAYKRLSQSETLGVILRYSKVAPKSPLERTMALGRQDQDSKDLRSAKPVVGFIGSGSYSARILLPSLRKTGVALETLVTSDGARGVRLGRRTGFKNISTDIKLLWGDRKINTVISASRHNQHASEVVHSLEAGKNIFVEKPLAISSIELDKVVDTVNNLSNRGIMPVLMVDFNRRFAPLALTMKNLISRQKQPKAFVYTVNAGPVPEDHWVHDPQIGGGRIIGEVCHFIDLICFLAGSTIQASNIVGLGDLQKRGIGSDTVSVSLTLADGSIGTIHYLANSSRHIPKEKLEVSCFGQTLQLSNFQSLTGYGWPGFQRKRLWRQNKGNKESLEAFLRSVRTDCQPPIPLSEIFDVSRVAIRLAESVT